MPASEPTTLTPSMTAMLAALSAKRGASVADLAEHAELGRSTAARVLTNLEGYGLARRERADRSVDRSAPDLWFNTEPSADLNESAETGTAAPDGESGPAVGGSEPDAQDATHTLSETEPDVPSRDNRGEPEITRTDEPASQTRETPILEAALEDPATATQADSTAAVEHEPAAGPEPDQSAGQAAHEPAPEDEAGQGGDANAPEPNTHGASEPVNDPRTADDMQAEAPTPSEAGATVRLGKGELRAMVADHLRAHPTEEFTASMVGKALVKSSGAVANVFDTLIKAGEAEMTCEKPRRFRHLAKSAH